MNTAAKDDDLVPLFDAVAQDALDPELRARLERRLHDDPAAQEAYRAYLERSAKALAPAAAPTAYEAPQAEAAPAVVPAESAAEPKGKPPEKSSPLKLLAMASALGTLVWFLWIAPRMMPSVPGAPGGPAVVTLQEGKAAHDEWWRLAELPPPIVDQWETDDFYLPRLPRRYDAWGVRESWKAPVLTRISAYVELPAGPQTFLLRSRGLGRLWIDGRLVAETKLREGASEGHDPVKPPAEPPFPGLRPVGYGDQEVFGEAVLRGGWTPVVLESIVGGQVLRAEPGEMLAAIRSSDGAGYRLLHASGGEGVSLAEADMARLDAWTEASLAEHDDQTRRKAAASRSDYWEKRHALARDWVKRNPAPAPKSSAPNPIDAFLADKVSAALAASSGDPAEAQRFHAKVLPLLRDNCFRCHGDKAKGGLRLNSRAAALQGGDSGAVLAPGSPEQSELLRRVRSNDLAERMPPSGRGLSAEQTAALEEWIKNGAAWPAPPVAPAQVAFAPRVDDSAFLRRAWLDVVGVPPPADEVRKFLADAAPDKRERMVDRLLADGRFADHWMSYWQDVLGENPSMVAPTLNNSGPFRWFLYDALRDGTAVDRWVSELASLRGSEREGGAAGFGMAADNDAPLAAKSQVLASAFLGIELQCARCHDSPYHSTKQRDLYGMAAMLARKPLAPPKSNTVSPGFFEKKARESLIQATLKPGEEVPPTWPFADATGSVDDAALSATLLDPKDTRERLAALLTSPHNERFAQVVANRVWKRLLGAGIVEPAHDWEGKTPSHPELLTWLARDFVEHDYSLKHLVRRIMTSDAYQREARGANLTAPAELRFFTAPERRRLTAEQVVDSLFAASGQKLDVEELALDPEGQRPKELHISLGRPSRAWMFASLSNERDRPSLSLPRAQAVTDVMEAFGWSSARQGPVHERESAPMVIQPGVLENGLLSTWISRAVEGGGLAQDAVEAKSPAALVEQVYLRFLGRLPTAAERAPYDEALAKGFDQRILPAAERAPPPPPDPRLARVTWANMLTPEANTIKMEMERRARLGPPPDRRLAPTWRAVYEDFVWAVMNSPEFVWAP